MHVPSADHLQTAATSSIQPYNMLANQRGEQTKQTFGSSGAHHEFSQQASSSAVYVVDGVVWQ